MAAVIAAAVAVVVPPLLALHVALDLPHPVLARVAGIFHRQAVERLRLGNDPWRRGVRGGSCKGGQGEACGDQKLAHPMSPSSVSIGMS